MNSRRFRFLDILFFYLATNPSWKSPSYLLLSAGTVMVIGDSDSRGRGSGDFFI